MVEEIQDWMSGPGTKIYWSNDPTIKSDDMGLGVSNKSDQDL